MNCRAQDIVATPHEPLFGHEGGGGATNVATANAGYDITTQGLP